jgi:short-subunit dehydrogenase
MSLATQTDVSEFSDVNRMVDMTLEKFGKVDILVNNAGFTSNGLFYKQDINEQEKMVLVHNIAMMKLAHFQIKIKEWTNAR